MMDENKLELNESGEQELPASEAAPEKITPSSDESVETEPDAGAETVTAETDEVVCDESTESEEAVGAEKDEELTEKSAEEPKEEVYAFRWEYSEQSAHDKGTEKRQEKKGVRGAIGYAAVMIAVFALAFSILFAAMSFDDMASWFNPPEGYSIKEVVKIGMPSSVAIFSNNGDGTGGSGSGFFLTSSGYVITNYHVVENSVSIIVVDSNDKDYSATLVNYDKELDVALLYVEGGLFTPVTIGDSDSVELGETVVAIGCPYGEGFMFSPSNGIISGVDRQLSGSSGMLQTNAPLNPGNSGGPLFDSMGRVIGIVTSKLISVDDADGEKITLEGMAFAIPINEAKVLADQWIKEDLERAMLGVTAVSVEGGQSYFFNSEEGRIYVHQKKTDGDYIRIGEDEFVKLTDELLADKNNYIFAADVTGVVITSVTKGLGADGVLLPKDTVTEVDGIKVTTVPEIKAIFDRFNPGDKVTVKFYRDGEYRTAQMTLKTKGDMLKAEGY